MAPGSRRTWWRLSRVLVVASLAIFLAGEYAVSSVESPFEGRPDRAPVSRQPNIVVVMSDDQDIASMAVMRHVQGSLADHGVTFRNSFATDPLCCPSRATFLTGQYAHNHGVLSNTTPDGGFPALDGSNTLPLWLSAAGYRTAYMGKYLNLYGVSAQGQDPTLVPPGWQEWRAFVEHTEYQMYDYTQNVNGRLVHHGNRPRDYQTDVLARQSSRFVKSQAADSSPFFLAVAPVAPHDEGVLENKNAFRNPRPAPRDLGRFSNLPLPRPPSFNERDLADKPRPIRHGAPLSPGDTRQLTTLYRSRMESLLAVDDLVGRLVRTLRETGQLRRTVIVYTSDNGFLLGEHRQIGKQQVYEESVRVPLVIRGPGFPSGAVRDQLVGNIDLAPTITDLAGATPGLPPDGLSLLRLAADPNAHRRRPLVLESFEARPFRAIRTPRYTFARYTPGGSELYDLRADPYELHNLRRDPAYQGIKRRLSQRLAALQDCAGAACR